MTKLELSAIPDDRPVKLTVELPCAVHRDLVAYAEMFAPEQGQHVEPAKLVPSMLARFMSTDRAFVRARRARVMRAEPRTNKRRLTIARREHSSQQQGAGRADLQAMRRI